MQKYFPESKNMTVDIEFFYGNQDLTYDDLKVILNDNGNIVLDDLGSKVNIDISGNGIDVIFSNFIVIIRYDGIFFKNISSKYDMIPTRFYGLLLILSKIYYERYRKDLRQHECDISINHTCYPKFTIQELYDMKYQSNEYLYDKIPVIPMIYRDLKWKKFFISLSPESKSEMKEILIRIIENDEVITIECSDYLGFGKYHSVNLSLSKGEYDINRTEYNYSCGKFRKMICPLQSGKSVLKLLYLLAWFMNVDSLVRTDMSMIVDCQYHF